MQQLHSTIHHRRHVCEYQRTTRSFKSRKAGPPIERPAKAQLMYFALALFSRAYPFLIQSCIGALMSAEAYCAVAGRGAGAGQTLRLVSSRHAASAHTVRIHHHATSAPGVFRSAVCSSGGSVCRNQVRLPRPRPATLLGLRSSSSPHSAGPAPHSATWSIFIFSGTHFECYMASSPATCHSVQSVWCVCKL